MSNKSRYETPRLDGPSSATGERRRARRLDVAQPAEMELGQFSGYIEALDLSVSGVRCRVSTGFAPFEGDRMVVTFVDGTSRSGRVRWTRGHEFGLEFDYALKDPGDMIHIECWSGDNYANLLRFQMRMPDNH